MSSSETFSPEQRTRLLDLAEASIRHGLEHGRPLPVSAVDFPEPLRDVRATFVTLHRDGELRGCIGALEASLPLVEDVARHAFAAAFEDPRFPPLRPAELPGLELEISVLSPPQDLPVADEAELLAALRPGRDGLILRAGWRRSTFLPTVWQSLPDPRDFLAHLKLKAGLPAEGWSDQFRFERYETEIFGRSVPAAY